MQTVKFLIFSFWSNGIMQRVRQLQRRFYCIT
jgi:hypothetical protein